LEIDLFIKVEMITLYIVQCRDGSYYTGTAKDPEARILQHNEGKGARYTRGRRPVEWVYSEVFETRGEAMRREADIKRWSKEKKRELVEGKTRLAD
jgi:predicted GIY-YIG superfamily endonuclease